MAKTEVEGAALVKGGIAAKLAALKGDAKPAKGKGKTPSVTIKAEVDKMEDGKPVKKDGCVLFLDALKRKKDAEREMDDLYGPIAEEAEKVRVEMSRKAGEVQSSLRVNNRLTYTATSRYTAIQMDDAEKVEALKGIFGEQLFDTYFKPENEVAIKTESLDDDLIEDLVAICAKRGVEFDKLFAVKQVLKPVERLTNDRILRPEVEALFKQAHEQGIIKPYKASLKEAGS